MGLTCSTAECCADLTLKSARRLRCVWFPTRPARSFRSQLVGVALEWTQDGVYHWVLLDDSWTRTERWENRGERWVAAVAERKDNEFVFACSSLHATQIVRGTAQSLKIKCGFLEGW